MNEFPRTTVGGVSLPRLIIGSNWFLGASHTSLAKDKLIKSLMDRKHIEDILVVFLQAGVDAILRPPSFNPILNAAIDAAEQRTGRKMIRIITPGFEVTPGKMTDFDAERAVEQCKNDKATFCLPHQMVTDA